MKIQKTKEYKKFKYLPWNRDIDAKKLKELCNKMALNNLTKDLPVLVDKKMQVLDGQHRISACKELGLPVWYKVADKATVNDIAFMQTNAKWQPKDYIKFWKVKGNRNYILFDKFIKKFELPVNTALEVIGDRHRKRIDLQNGQLKFNETNFHDGCHLVYKIYDFAPIFKHYKNRSFMRAMSTIMSFKQYDHKRMKSKASLVPFSRRGDTDSYIAMIEEVYNYRAQIKVYFSHMIKEARNGIAKRK